MTSVAAAPPSSFKLIGHPKECSCLDATDAARQAELETFLAQTPGVPLLPANHDKGERCQRLGHRIVDRSVTTLALLTMMRSQPFAAEHGRALRQCARCARPSPSWSRGVAR